MLTFSVGELKLLKLNFEKTPAGDVEISEQEYFDNGLLMVAMVKAGVELAFEAMTDAGIIEESCLLRVPPRDSTHREHYRS